MEDLTGCGNGCSRDPSNQSVEEGARGFSRPETGWVGAGLGLQTAPTLGPRLSPAPVPSSSSQ